jgi:NADPH-dependent ferric siderophore reductase
MSDARRPERPRNRATVLSASWLSPTMVRVVFSTGADFSGAFADSYVKLLFGDSMRAYTVRAASGSELTIDFVVHGDEGLAGPWAASAAPGDSLEFVGPGGEWSPRPAADWHLFVGDESALPAVASGLQRLLDAKPDANALVFAEIGTAGEEYPLPAGPGVSVTWVTRDGAPYGEPLTAAVLNAEFPAGDVEAFVHGNAEMVRPLRRYLLRERELPRGSLSISGYWRSGMTDEGWRASKREFNALMEAEA